MPYVCRPPTDVCFLAPAKGDSTPSAAFDVDASYPWNAGGDGLLMESLEFPVVLVTGGGAADEVRARAVSNGNLGERSIVFLFWSTNV